MSFFSLGTLKHVFQRDLNSGINKAKTDAIKWSKFFKNNKKEKSNEQKEGSNETDFENKFQAPLNSSGNLTEEDIKLVTLLTLSIYAILQNESSVVKHLALLLTCSEINSILEKEAKEWLIQ